MKDIELIEQDDRLSYTLGMADNILQKNYLSLLPECEILGAKIELSTNELAERLNKSVRFIELTQIVLDKNENMRDKLVSVFNAVWSTGATLLFQIKGDKNKVSIYLGVKSNDNNLEKTILAQNALENSIGGNFPGTRLSCLKVSELKECVLDNFDVSQSVAAVTDIAGLRNDEESHEKLFIQGIEKIIDGMQGKTYTLFLIADPVSVNDLNINRRALENIYTSLVPLSESTHTIGYNESDAINQVVTESVTDSVSQSIAESVSHTQGITKTHTEGFSNTDTSGTSSSTTETKGKSISIGKNASINAGISAGKNASKNVGINVGIPNVLGVALGGALGTFLGRALGASLGGNLTRTSFESESKTEGVSFSHSDTNSNSFAVSSNSSESIGTTKTNGTSHSVGKSKADGTTHTIGESMSFQVKFENHSVTQMMKQIDKILERYDSCADLGMWNCAMYCISDKNTAQTAANIYRSIIRGKNSSLESSGITVWNRKEIPDVMNALRHMEHPLINYEGLTVTPGTLVSSAELAIHAGLPNHSIPGLPVIKCAGFGRTISSYDSDDRSENHKLYLGKIYHMHSVEELPVELTQESLCSHTFITGATGSGKSNTIYQLLSEVIRNKRKFLVVESAKGEYKNIFGGESSVAVYGTNPDLASLLHINPFSFPCGSENPSENIHILEHLDRLIEIFNVCWPMYAAMPAVLKEAIEKSYEDCGWNLTESMNPYGENLYPTFADVTRNIKTIIDLSEYDAENKGAYKGSLITRLKSLTNGINGLIFTTDEISNKDLFDENVIVDLSRVGSAETKSLIMGLLVLKLQEYRMTSSGMNSDLKHVTVLEEAHNLLKRTSTEQSQDSENLIGKSVEMLANAIAEMRTYGEGFIIADQAPGLLDMAVIRNTNTKIIMRLPDQNDRELVGKAANLNDDQITELAKLPCGVAAVYQNEWVEPVLCMVDHYTDLKSYVRKEAESSKNEETKIEHYLEVAKLLCSGTKLSSIEEAKEKIDNFTIPASTKVQIIKLLLNPSNKPRFKKLSPLVSDLLPEVKTKLSKVYEVAVDDPILWTNIVDKEIKQIDEDIEIERLRDIRQCIITQFLYNELNDEKAYYKWREVGVK